MADFRNNRYYRKLHDCLQLMQQMHISTHAAHACFFLVLSVFPLLVLMLGVLRYTALQPEDLINTVAGLLPDALLPHAWSLIRSAYHNTSRLVVSLSALTALWSAGRGIYALQAGLNAVYGIHTRRRWLHSRILCAGYTFLFVLVVLLTLILNVFGNTVVRFLQQRPGCDLQPDMPALRFFLPVGVQALLFCAMFMFLPNERHGFWESLPGALFSAFGWMSASGAFSVYVHYFPRYANIFGSVYAAALGSLWLYVCVSILFYGALLNRILAQMDENG